MSSQFLDISYFDNADLDMETILHEICSKCDIHSRSTLASAQKMHILPIFSQTLLNSFLSRMASE